jgi:hypothetical protein
VRCKEGGTARPHRRSAQQRFPKKAPQGSEGRSPSELIDLRIAELHDWRGERLAQLRSVIRAADAGITDEWKWSTPVWSCCGILCTGEMYKKAVTALIRTAI